MMPANPATSSFRVPHPAEKTAATELHQPGIPVAAVTISEPAHFLPPCASLLAEALPVGRIGASAFSSVFPSAGDRQAVVPVGSASAATANRVLKNTATLRVVAAILIAFNAAANSQSFEA